MTPPVVAIHDADAVRIYSVGDSASTEVQAIAEDGNLDPLVTLATSQPATVISAAGVAAPSPAGPVLPGETVSIELTTDNPGHALSLIAMVVCTNDGFTGLDSISLPGPAQSTTASLVAYDAGTEQNILDPDYWVPPCGGAPGNLRQAESGVVTLHPGQSGTGDRDFDSGAIVASVTVENLSLAAPSAVADGNIVHIISAVSGRWLDADTHYHYTRVDTSSSPKFDDEWKLEQTSDGYWQLFSPARGLYLDADTKRKNYDVNLGRKTQWGTTWEIIPLDNGNYLLRATDLDRYLDYDRHNVDTSSHPREDDEWMIRLVAS